MAWIVCNSSLVRSSLAHRCPAAEKSCRAKATSIVFSSKLAGLTAGVTAGLTTGLTAGMTAESGGFEASLTSLTDKLGKYPDIKNETFAAKVSVCLILTRDTHRWLDPFVSTIFQFPLMSRDDWALGKRKTWSDIIIYRIREDEILRWKMKDEASLSPK